MIRFLNRICRRFLQNNENNENEKEINEKLNKMVYL